MIYTREQIGAMTEAQLREMVLIPLFRAMSFRDVTHFHGGPLDQGKDIVMWNVESSRASDAAFVDSWLYIPQRA